MAICYLLALAPNGPSDHGAGPSAQLHDGARARTTSLSSAAAAPAGPCKPRHSSSSAPSARRPSFQAAGHRQPYPPSAFSRYLPPSQSFPIIPQPAAASTRPPPPPDESPESPESPESRVNQMTNVYATHGPPSRSRTPSFSRRRLSSSFGFLRAAKASASSVLPARKPDQPFPSQSPGTAPCTLANGLLSASPLPAIHRIARSMEEVRAQPSFPASPPRIRRKSHDGQARHHMGPSRQRHMSHEHPRSRRSNALLVPPPDPLEVLSNPEDDDSPSNSDTDTDRDSTFMASEPGLSSQHTSGMASSRGSLLTPHSSIERSESDFNSTTLTLPPSHKRWASYWARMLTSSQDPRMSVRSILPVPPRKVTVTRISVVLSSPCGVAIQLGRYDDEAVSHLTQWERQARRTFLLHGDHHPGSDAYDLALGAPRRPDLDPSCMEKEEQPVTQGSEADRQAQLDCLRARLRAKNSWGVNVDAEAETVRTFPWSASSGAPRGQTEMQLQNFAALACHHVSNTPAHGWRYDATLSPFGPGVCIDADREVCIKLTMSNPPGPMSKPRPRCHSGTTPASSRSPRKLFPTKLLGGVEPAASWAWMVPSFEGSGSAGRNTLTFDAKDLDNPSPNLVALEVEWSCSGDTDLDQDSIPTF